MTAETAVPATPPTTAPAAAPAAPARPAGRARPAAGHRGRARSRATGTSRPGARASRRRVQRPRISAKYCSPSISTYSRLPSVAAAASSAQPPGGAVQHLRCPAAAAGGDDVRRRRRPPVRPPPDRYDRAHPSAAIVTASASHARPRPLPNPTPPVRAAGPLGAGGGGAAARPQRVVPRAALGPRGADGGAGRLDARHPLPAPLRHLVRRRAAVRLHPGLAAAALGRLLRGQQASLAEGAGGLAGGQHLGAALPVPRRRLAGDRRASGHTARPRQLRPSAGRADALSGLRGRPVHARRRRKRAAPRLDATRRRCRGRGGRPGSGAGHCRVAARSAAAGRAMPARRW